MAYNPQTWTDGVSSANASRLTHMETGIDEAHALVAERRMELLVGSVDLPQSIKDACDYVCDGVDDQVQINQALLRASRPADGFGGEGITGVALVGPTFRVGDNGGVITMYPGTKLRGGGWGTMVEPRFSSATTSSAAIELLNTAVAHVAVEDLCIGRPSFTAANGNGIRFEQSGDGQTYSVRTGNDPFCIINNVLILQVTQWGVRLEGTNSGARETHLYGVHGFGPQDGVFYIGSTDCKLVNCTANAGNGPGYHTVSGSSGNVKLSNCKAYYCDTYGFELLGARAELNGCSAQDNGEWGYYINNGDMSMTGCVADSNSRLSASAGGFRLGGTGVYEGLHAFDRNQTPSSRQTIGINFPFTGSDVFVTGRVMVPAGGTHITGSGPSSSSYARVLRSGSTLYSVG